MAFRNISKSIGTSFTSVYICPNNYEAVLHSLYISNTDASNDITVDVQLTTSKPGNPGVAGSYKIVSNIKILAGTTLILDKPVNLRSTDELKIQSSASTCDAVGSILLTNEDALAPN
jgi:hypothetical protein